jgi:hypothetical protein
VTRREQGFLGRFLEYAPLERDEEVRHFRTTLERILNRTQSYKRVKRLTPKT